LVARVLRGVKGGAVKEGEKERTSFLKEQAKNVEFTKVFLLLFFKKKGLLPVFLQAASSSDAA
jgi:hypothetical protein